MWPGPCAPAEQINSFPLPRLSSPQSPTGPFGGREGGSAAQQGHRAQQCPTTVGGAGDAYGAAGFCTKPPFGRSCLPAARGSPTAAGHPQLPNPKQGTSIAQRHPALFGGRAKQAALNCNTGDGTEPGAAQASQNSDRACFKDSSLVSPESSSLAVRFARGSTRRSCQPRAPAVGARLPCQPAPSSFAEMLGFLTRQHRGVQKITL